VQSGRDELLVPLLISSSAITFEVNVRVTTRRAKVQLGDITRAQIDQVLASDSTMLEVRIAGTSRVPRARLFHCSMKAGV